jgi:glutamyl-tRNA reductase
LILKSGVLNMPTTYPINLLLSDSQKCGVIGAGKVAKRKLYSLLNSPLEITVIAPTIHIEISTWETDGKLVVKQSELQSLEQLLQFDIVFAATSDTPLNKEIVHYCKTHHILCCAVDENWIDGGFISPATLTYNDVTIAISTNGESCRKTRMIKNSLKKQIPFMDSAELLIVGTDHNYLSLEEREPLHLNGDKLEQVGAMLQQLSGIHEFMLLNTCNRIEFIGVIHRNSVTQTLIETILNFVSLRQDSYYIKYGYEAFTHLSMSVAGLMSQTPGEKHIVAQFKESFNHSKTLGYASSMMQQWLNTTLHISKDIRHVIEPLLKNFEIEDLSIQYIKESLKSKFEHANVLVIGTGIIGHSIVEKLIGSVASIQWCYHKNRPELKPFDGENITLHNLNNLKNLLEQVDIIVTSAASNVSLLHQGHAPFFDQTRDVLIVDLAMPRNVSHNLGDVMPNLTIADLDDLKHWYRRKGVDMAHLFELSSKIISEHKEMYEKIIFDFQGRNTRK